MIQKQRCAAAQISSLTRKSGFLVRKVGGWVVNRLSPVVIDQILKLLCTTWRCGDALVEWSEQKLLAILFRCRKIIKNNLQACLKKLSFSNGICNWLDKGFYSGKKQHLAHQGLSQEKLYQTCGVGHQARHTWPEDLLSSVLTSGFLPPALS